MLEIKFTEAAEGDLVEARDWYEAELAGLGDRLVAEVGYQLERISQNYQQFPLVRRAARRALLRNFPDAVIFRVVGNIAYIVAIFHFSRNPRIWRKRL